MAQAKKDEAKTDVVTDEVEPTPFEKAKALTMSRFHLKADRLNTWYVESEMGTTVEQVKDETYWANISMHLRAGDEIHVMPDDMSWELVLHVAGAGNQFAHVIEKSLHNLKPATAPVKLPSIYTVEFAGSHHKWRFLRDGKMMRDGFETESLARLAAANHEAAVNR